jgi:hypothetical protein
MMTGYVMSGYAALSGGWQQSCRVPPASPLRGNPTYKSLWQRLVALEHFDSAIPCVAVIVATIGTGRFSWDARLQIESVGCVWVHHEFERTLGTGVDLYFPTNQIQNNSTPVLFAVL